MSTPTRHPVAFSPLRAAMPSRRCRQRGLTLVEMLTALAVSSVVLGSALPGLQAARERQHLEGAAAQLQTDLQLMRGIAQAQSRSLRLALASDAGGSCYVIHDGDNGQCRCDSSGAARCDGAAQALRIQGFALAGPVQLRGSSGALTLDPVRGTFSPTATLQFQAQGGAALHVVVNLLGRVRHCSPSGAVPGYPTC